MELHKGDRKEIAAQREARRRDTVLGIVPIFYTRLADEADAHLIVEPRPAGGHAVMGYVLTLARPHDGHSHVTAIELQLDPPYLHRYEDVLDLLREELHPTAYLTRTDDCLYNATLLARGHQVEPTALVMLWRPADPKMPGLATTAAEAAAAMAPPATLATLTLEHFAGIRGLLDPDTDAEMLSELEVMAASGRGWAVLKDSAPVAVIARRDGGDGVHELLDFAFARAGESVLEWALGATAAAVAREGLRPAGVIDATEGVRHRVFRAAGFFTAASYLVYYDPMAGRPSVATVSTADLRGIMQRGEHVHLVDVLGEEHWNEGHLPGSEWIDFKGLGREARRRFEPDEPLIVYCSGFT